MPEVNAVKRTVRLYWQEACAHAVPAVTQALTVHFPVVIVLAAAQEPTHQAFDTSRGQYDAAYLLQELPETVFDDGNNPSTETPLILWLIEEDISYIGRDYLYGTAWRNLAVVSTVRIGFGEDLLKEVCHEIGHLFGLEHCFNSCLMSTSSSRRQLAAKPMLLCSECSSRILKSNH